MNLFKHKYNLKRKKGAILADVFIAFTVASIVGTAIMGYIHLSSKLTESQIQTMDAYNVATTYLEQLQSSNIAINDTATTDEKRNNLEYLFQKINVDDVDNKNNTVNNATNPNYLFETNHKSNGIDYKVSILLERDTYNPNFHIFRINVAWQNNNGYDRDIDLVGYKVGVL